MAFVNRSQNNRQFKTIIKITTPSKVTSNLSINNQFIINQHNLKKKKKYYLHLGKTQNYFPKIFKPFKLNQFNNIIDHNLQKKNQNKQNINQNHQNFFFKSHVQKGLFNLESKNKYNQNQKQKYYLINQDQLKKIKKKSNNNKIINKNLLKQQKNINYKYNKQIKFSSSIQKYNKQQFILSNIKKQNINIIHSQSINKSLKNKDNKLKLKSKQKKIKKESSLENIQNQLQLNLKVKQDKKPIKSSFRYKKTNQIKSNESFTSEQSDYIKDATPGPGQYEIKNSLIEKTKQKTIPFTYSQSRFPPCDIKFNEVTYVNKSNKQITRKNNQVFISKSPKISLHLGKQTPDPGFYDTRETLQYKYIDKLSHNFKNVPFQTTQKRLLSDQCYTQVGPGFYNIEQNNNFRHQYKNPTYCYKSKVNRCRSIEKQQQKQKQNKVIIDQWQIQKEDKKICNFQIYMKQSPPFLSNAERFPKQKIEEKTSEKIFYASLPEQSQSLKAKVGFNSTTIRQLPFTIGQGIGVGSYQLDNYKWNKKSYNKLFNN